MTEPCDNETVDAAPRPDAGLRWLQRAAWILLVLGVCGFLIDGANRPANPYLLPAGHHQGAPAAG